MDIQNAIVPNIEIPKSVDQACENLTSKPTQEMGNTLADIWFLVFGGLTERAEKKRLKVAANIEQYKAELTSAVKAIPEESWQEPKLQIAGPALEKSQYCVEEKELRAMFVKLISRSMDKSFEDKIRPSFADIISQMAPLDAQNLIGIGKSGNQAPIAEFRNNLAKEGYQTVKTNVFLQNPEVNNIDVQASSLSELSRLGLLSISYEQYSLNPGLYDVFEQHPLFQRLKLFIPPIPDGGYQFPRDNHLIKNVEVKKGIAELTPLGIDFLDVCLIDHVRIS